MFMISPISPSKTLASYLANYTQLPFVVWIIILKEKFQLEKNMLDDGNYGKQYDGCHKLRSGAMYVNLYSDTNLRLGLRCQAQNLFRTFDSYKRLPKYHPERCRMLYNCCYRFMDFVVSWCHYIIYNANVLHHQSYYKLYNQLCETSRNICYDYSMGKTYTRPTTKKDHQYFKWALEITNDIRGFRKYMTCQCNWHQNQNVETYPSNKCLKCREFEQYCYNNETYDNNYMVLRSGRHIIKPNAFKEKIIVNKVFKLD